MDIFNENPEYKVFLKEDGYIYGWGFDICGPISNNYERHKVDSAVSRINSLVSFWGETGMLLASSWLWKWHLLYRLVV